MATAAIAAAFDPGAVRAQERRQDGSPVREVTVAVLAYQGSERAARDFEPTLAHLNRSLPGHRFTMRPLDPAGIERAVAARSVDFVVTNPGYYVELESRSGVTRIATLETRDRGGPTDTVGSTVIARAVPGAPQALADLAGRRVAVVAAGAFGGWRVIRRELAQAGVTTGELAALVETGFPMESVIDALRAGRADAGVLRACLLEEQIAAGRARIDEFRIVGERPVEGFGCRVSSRLYPDWPFARLAGTAPDLAKSVAASLLTMTPVGERAWTAPSDYTAVHALFRELKIGPYERLAHPSLRELVDEYRYGLALAAFAVIWWVLHVARVETLVRRRTAELTRAIQARDEAERIARRHREERDQFSRLGILGEMASNIAHELNQPLAAIANYAEGITRFIDAGRDDPAFIRDGARGIAGQAERAGQIIRRIRGFVRRRELKREPVDVNDVVEEALAWFQPAAARRGIPVQVRRGNGLPVIVADAIEIEQVLLNLLQNALDAMLDGDAHDRGILLATQRSGDSVQIAVRDHGSGMSADVQARLFDTFFTTKPNGLGLGLSLCRTIVENHGGRLWATAEPDGGTTMRVTLPIAPEQTN